MSNDQILEKLHTENPHSIPVLKAMDEARKDGAIEFAEWAGGARDRVYKAVWEYNGVDYSTSELYNEFKKHNP